MVYKKYDIVVTIYNIHWTLLKVFMLCIIMFVGIKGCFEFFSWSKTKAMFALHKHDIRLKNIYF